MKKIWSGIDVFLNGADMVMEEEDWKFGQE